MPQQKEDKEMLFPLPKNMNGGGGVGGGGEGNPWILSSVQKRNSFCVTGASQWEVSMKSTLKMPLSKTL